jgi:hypothetical protein
VHAYHPKLHRSQIRRISASGKAKPGKKFTGWKKVEHAGTHLSSQLHGRHKISGLQSRPVKARKARPYVKNNFSKKGLGA